MSFAAYPLNFGFLHSSYPILNAGISALQVLKNLKCKAASSNNRSGFI